MWESIKVANRSSLTFEVTMVLFLSMQISASGGSGAIMGGRKHGYSL